MTLLALWFACNPAPPADSDTDVVDVVDTDVVDSDSDTDVVDTDVVDSDSDTDVVDTDVVDSDTDSDVVDTDPPLAPDFSLADLNTTSPTAGQQVSPRDYLQKVSGWYFTHAT